MLRRQSGSNLLVVGQNDGAALGMFATGLVSLAAQHPASVEGRASFYVFDGAQHGSEESTSLARLPALTSDTVRVVGGRELAAAVGQLSAELARRQEAAETPFPPVYVFVYGLQRMRDLRRQEDDFGFSRSGEEKPPDPAKQFATIVRDGPAFGIHAIVWCDSLNNLHRTWDRQTLREFEYRVVLQMSANDSSALIDTPVASRLGANRALIYSGEEEALEKFRPYRWPSPGWLERVRQQLRVADDAEGAKRLTV